MNTLSAKSYVVTVINYDIALVSQFNFVTTFRAVKTILSIHKHSGAMFPIPNLPGIKTVFSVFGINQIVTAAVFILKAAHGFLWELQFYFFEFFYCILEFLEAPE